jgi:hypothetical protein
MACIEDHPAKICYKCNRPYEIKYTGEVKTFPDAPELSYPVIMRKCNFCEEEFRSEQGELLPWGELLPGECKRLAWRGYDNMLGGLCDICMDRFPINEHSHFCGCARCKNAPGPLIILRSKLVDKKKLHVLQNAYREIFGIDRPRIWRQPFTESLHYSEERIEATLESEERFGGDFSEFHRPGPRHSKMMDELSSCYIEVHPNYYQLKMFGQLPEHILGGKYLKYIDECEQMVKWARSFQDPDLLETTINACDYIRYHLLGRTFDFEDLARHLLNNRSPNMQEFMLQAYYIVLDYIDSNCPIIADQINPLALTARCHGFLHSLPFTIFDRERDIWLRFQRYWGADVVFFDLQDRDFGGSRFEFNTGWIQEERDIPDEDRILEHIGWALDRGE